MASKLVVPARSWNGEVSGVAGASAWIVLGPMAMGAWLRRLRVTIYAPSTTVIIFCPVLTSVGEPAAAALAAGRGLIDQGGVVVQRKPCLRWTSVDRLSISFDVYVGLEIATDARWLVCLCEEQAGTANATFTVSAELVRLE